MKDETKNIFALRKLTIGLASVMLSTCFVIAQKGETVKADTTNDNSDQESVSDQTTQNTEAIAQKQADASNVGQKATIVSSDTQSAGNVGSVGTKSEDSQAVDNVKSQLNAGAGEGNESKVHDDKTSENGVNGSGANKSSVDSNEQKVSETVDANGASDEINADTQTGKIVYFDQNGKQVGTTLITGKTGETIKIIPEIPDGYVINDNKPVPTSAVVNNDGIPNVTVSVIKKETATGTPETQHALPVKNIIVYKDNNGKVVGTQDVEGKSGDKVTPKVPDGYAATGDISDVTIPSDGTPITINVVKKESATGTPLVQPELPAYTGPIDTGDDGNDNNDNTPNVSNTLDNVNVPTTDEGIDDKHLAPISFEIEKQGKQSFEFDGDTSDNDSSDNSRSGQTAQNISDGLTHTAYADTTTSNVNTQKTLPQTGEKDIDPTVYSAFAMALGLDLLVGSYESKRKRKRD